MFVTVELSSSKGSTIVQFEFITIFKRGIMYQEKEQVIDDFWRDDDNVRRNTNLQINFRSS